MGKNYHAASGHREKNEFRREERRHELRAARPAASIAPAWPALRIVRMATIDDSHPTREWGSFLNDLGRRNYNAGSALSLGSVTITLVSAQDMGRMLEDRYPRAYHDRGDTQELHSEVRDRIRSYLRYAAREAYDAMTRDMQRAHGVRMGDFLTAFSNELEDPFESEFIASAEKATASAEALATVLPMADTARSVFDAQVFAVDGLALYGRGYGLNLTGNEDIYTSRDNLTRYLRNEEGLNTNLVRWQDWDAHATVFKLYDHLSAAPLKWGEHPGAIDFDAVRADAC